jgi:hypothetical protein
MIIITISQNSKAYINSTTTTYSSTTSFQETITPASGLIWNPLLGVPFRAILGRIAHRWWGIYILSCRIGLTWWWI